MNLVIFTEEPSMKETLKHLLPRLGVDLGKVRIISFDGVGNMKKSLPGQLRALASDASIRVLILRDNDNGSCLHHKSEIIAQVKSAGIMGRVKVRIVCQMLESWFIGDADALVRSNHFKKPIPRRLTNCDPDGVENPKSELRKLRDGYNEISGARVIAPHLDPLNNRSVSFRNTVQAIRDLTAA